MTHEHLANNPDQHPSVLWDRCMGIIQDNVSLQTFKTWFEPIRAVKFCNGQLTIQVPSQFFYEWLEEHYVDIIGKTIRRVIGKDAGLEYRIQMDSSPQPATIQLRGHTRSQHTSTAEIPLKLDNPRDIINPFVISGVKKLQIDAQLNPKLTFENYVEGESNRLSRTAGVHIAKKPGATSFNPLMVYGSTGCGKTHLLQAIGNEVRNVHQHKVVLYVSAEKFINQFIEHSKKNLINDFIHFYQLIDVLLVDDIHLFSTAPKTQDVFFAIFNHLHQNGKQLVLTSDTPVQQLQGLNERLLSRFRWGLTAEINEADFDMRQNIVHSMMHNEGLEVPEEVVEYVAFNIEHNLRDLEGAIISLFAQATLTGKEIDLDLAKKVVKNYVTTSSRELSIEDIQKMVCAEFNITYDELLSKSRKQEIVKARQITMYLARDFTNSTLKSIGKHFAGKDHTTVIHSCQTVENRLDTDPSYKERFQSLKHKVKLASI